MGVHLNTKKTRSTHTLNIYQDNVGVDFLGFTIRQFPVGKTHTGKNTKGNPLGFKTIIKASKEAIHRHTQVLKKKVRALRAAPQDKLIKTLNPITRGWANYYRTVVSSKAFATCDDTLYHQLYRWARYRHPQKGWKWISQKYWRTIEDRHWVFATPEGDEIRTHRKTTIQRHVLVKGNASPFDGELVYWSQRLKDHPLIHRKLGKLLKKQQGKCRLCELLFRDGDMIEIDHITPRSLGGTDDMGNLCAMHRHCHDQRHAPSAETGINDK